MVAEGMTSTPLTLMAGDPWRRLFLSSVPFRSRLCQELFRETLSEKNPRKLHKPIPKGILGSFIISVKSLKNMAGDAMDVCLRVLKEAHKNRYDTYSVRKVPCFATVMQLKQYFLQNCKEEIFPATDTTFQIGYYADGNKKFSILPKSSSPKRFLW